MVQPRRDERHHRRAGMFRHRPASTPISPDPPTTRHTRYVDGGHLVQVPRDTSVADAQEFIDGDPNRAALLLYPNPTREDIAELASSWRLHPLLVEDLLHGGQRSKLERHDDALFIVVRSAWYVDAAEDVDFAEFHILLRPKAVAVLCQDGRWIDGREADAASGTAAHGGHALLEDDHLLHHGPEAVVYRLLDAIVDEYTPVLRGLAIDKAQIERQVFGGDTTVTERIYRLSEEVIDLQQATSGLAEVLAALQRGSDHYSIPEGLKTYLQDVADHLSRVDAQVSELRASLSQILTVNGTLVAQRQNEDMKKISGWAAILFAPTLIGAIYGMNFDIMPELHWAFGYPLALGSMVAFALILYLLFKRQKWM